MTPGRFVSLWLLAIGVLSLLQFALGIASGAIEPRVSVYVLALVLPAVGALSVGLDRMRRPDGEKRPATYGAWTYPAILFLVAAAGWFLFGVHAALQGP